MAKSSKTPNKRKKSKTTRIVVTDRVDMSKTGTKLDWDAVEREYVTSEEFVPLTKLAKKYKVSNRSMYRWCHRGRWAKKRGDFWKEIHETVLDDVKETTVQRRLSRLMTVQQTVDDLIESLASSGSIATMQTSDLKNMLQIENAIMQSIPALQDQASSEFNDTVKHIIERNTLIVKEITNGQPSNVAEVGLRRLGIVESFDSGDTDAEPSGETKVNGIVPRRSLG